MTLTIKELAALRTAVEFTERSIRNHARTTARLKETKIVRCAWSAARKVTDECIRQERQRRKSI